MTTRRDYRRGSEPMVHLLRFVGVTLAVVGLVVLLPPSVEASTHGAQPHTTAVAVGRACPTTGANRKNGHGPAGTPDPHFARRGLYQPSKQAGDDDAIAIKGGLIVAQTHFTSTPKGSTSHSILERLTTKGKVDKSFGQHGSVHLTWPEGSMALLPGNKVLVAMSDNDAPSTNHLRTYSLRGKLDTSYGKNGSATIPVDANSGNPVAIAPDGRVGYLDQPQAAHGNGYQHATLTSLSANGRSIRKATLPEHGQTSVYGLSGGADNNWYFSSFGQGSASGSLYRVTPALKPDLRFGSAAQVAVEADGPPLVTAKVIYVPGTVISKNGLGCTPRITALHPNGTIDKAFGHDGQAEGFFSSHGNTIPKVGFATAIAVGAKHRLVVFGSDNLGVPRDIVGRLLRNGNRDTKFESHQLDVKGQGFISASSMTVRLTGDIYVSGQTFNNARPIIAAYRDK